MKTLSTITQELITANMTVDLQQGEVDTMLENEIVTLQNELATKVDSYVYILKKLDKAIAFQKELEDERKQTRKYMGNI